MLIQANSIQIDAFGDRTKKSSYYMTKIFKNMQPIYNQFREQKKSNQTVSLIQSTRYLQGQRHCSITSRKSLYSQCNISTILTMLTIYSKMRTIQKPVKSFNWLTGCGSDSGQVRRNKCRRESYCFSNCINEF